jgi:ribonuclease HII
MSKASKITALPLSGIRELLQRSQDYSEELLSKLECDPRIGARRLARSLRRRQAEHLRAEGRLRELTVVERDLHGQGVNAIVGVDEAGRGPLAGPVVSAAVIAPWPVRWLRLDDSKRLAPKEREEYAQRIKVEALGVGVGIISAERIDRIGILKATWESMRQALAGLKISPEHILVDGPWAIPRVRCRQTPLVNGDARCLSIAAASVVAKVTRDEIMERLDREYPLYGFKRHKGYGTAEHRQALLRHGPSPVHRRSFRGVRAESR